MVKKLRKKPVKKAIKKVKRVKKLKKFLVKKKKGARKIKKQAQDFSAQAMFKARIKVIGVGGGGGSIVSEIGRSLNKATFVIADTDSRAFKKRLGIKNFLFGQELTHGLGTGLNTDLARRAAEQEVDRIKKFFEHQDIVIFIACLGGGLGSGATQVFAQALEGFDGIALGIFTLPFKFEGKNKHAIAIRALNQLRRVLNVSITIPNERIFKIIDENTAITQAFSTVNKSLIESLESLIDLIYNPGVINIDFADVRAILSGKGSLAFLNTAQAAGKDRVQAIIHDILYNPLYQQNNFEAQKILFNIAGGGNLSMLEVDAISKSIAEKNPRAKIIFGISKHSEGKNKIKTTLLMTGPGAAAAPSRKEAESYTEKRRTAKKKKAIKLKKKQKRGVGESLIPVFGVSSQAQEVGAMQLSVVSTDEPIAKKTIRRSALEIKKAEEAEEQEKSQQEKEWEIPAFLRLKK